MGKKIIINKDGECVRVEKTTNQYNSTIIRHLEFVEVHYGPRMEKSEQNKEWEKESPGIDKFCVDILKEYQIKHDEESRIKKYNRRDTNNLGSHNGESRVSRADKMSGLDCYRMQGKSKASIKNFYTRKRRMFLKNEKNWDKI